MTIAGLWPGRRSLPLTVLTMMLVVGCTSLSTVVPETDGAPTKAPEEIAVSHPGAADTSAYSTPRNNDLRFERISLNEGLSQSVVLSILQDSRGFMWFGTQDGLNRYDGYEFVVYKNEPGDPDSLSDNFIQDLVEDRSGAIWIGTNAGGLNRFDPVTETFTNYRSDPSDPGSISDDDVSVVRQGSDGILWIGTTGSGLNRLDPSTGEFTRFRNNPADPNSLSQDFVTDILEDGEGRLWVGTFAGGLNRLDRITGGFVRYQNDPSDSGTLSSNAAVALHEDSAGILWVGTAGGGLNRLDRETGRFESYQNDPNDADSLSNNTVQAIYEDQAGGLWLGTGGGGLDRMLREDDAGAVEVRFVHYRYDPVDLHSLSNDQVQAVYGDDAGVLWLGTFGGGLSRVDPRQQQFARYRHDANDAFSLSDDIVWGFHQDADDVLWVATGNGGLNRLDPLFGEFVHFRNDPRDPQSLSNDQVWCVTRDREGHLWVGTNAGLDRLIDDVEVTGTWSSGTIPAQESARFAHYPMAAVLSIVEDSEGVLWVGTVGGGLGRLDREADQFSFYINDPTDPASLNDNLVVTIVEDQRGDLWVGTFNGGVDRFDRDTETFTHHANDPDDPGSLSHNTVLAVRQDGAGALWVGTAGGGLARLDRERQIFTHYREKDGLPNDTVYGILDDDSGHLWLSTNRGLAKFDPLAERFWTYDEGDGLQSNEFNMSAYYRGRSGEMYFGGVKGYNVFDPDSIVPSDYVAPVVITDFKLFNQSVAIGGRSPLRTSVQATNLIELAYDQDFFEFEFAALHYSEPEQNRYAYKMVGLDKDWNYVGSSRRFASYTSVPPGEYTFRVKATNSDGLWNEEGVSLGIVIAPPFWQTWWFRVVAALLVVGSGVGAAVGRIWAVEAQRRQLEVQVQERTKELRDTLVELERSRDAAQAANRAKSAFLANMSHEFRTPLNAILGFTQLMHRDAALTNGVRENVDIIGRSGEHLLGLINDVLELSKIEAGRTILKPDDFDLQRLLIGLEEMFRLRAERKGLSLEFDLEPDMPRFVRLDQGKLRQVLMNLLGNAVKFTQEGGVVLRAWCPDESVGATGARTARLHFEVEDSGPGIEPEEIRALFDPFVQTKSGRRTQEGTGLGLSISQQFVNLMGGEITVRSDPSSGSVFAFELPVEIADSESVISDGPPRRVLGLQVGQPTYRLLVVDDKDVNRRLLVKMLAPLGFELREATNGQEAIQIWEEWDPHLIWMDMRMPVMDGYEATRRIKATTKGQATVIIALTASALEEDRAIILSEGCDAYMRKPFRDSELFAVLEQHLGVRFVVEEIGADVQATAEEPSTAEKLALRQAIIDALGEAPAAWRDDLRRATILGELRSIIGLIEELRAQYPVLADELASLAHAYNHEGLLELLDSAGGDDEPPVD